MPSAPFRMTMPTQVVLRVLTRNPAQEWYGRQLGQEAGLPSGTLHPILARLERAGWLESHWEDVVDAREQGRPRRRRYYQLTPDGTARAWIALAEVRSAGGLDHRPTAAGGVTTTWARSAVDELVEIGVLPSCRRGGGRCNDCSMCEVLDLAEEVIARHSIAAGGMSERADP